MIYIASPFFTPDSLKFVISIENILRDNDIIFYTPRREGVLIDLSDEEILKRKTYIYNKNIEKIKKCNVILAVIDDRDTGTVWEMGYASALEKDIISVTNYDYEINVMLAESVRAHLKGTDELVFAINNKSFKGNLPEKVF